jgi:hypothetical protein
LKVDVIHAVSILLLAHGMKGRGATVEENATAATEANRLYWQTAKSVGDIAEKLGVSRRALYELIQPAPAGLQCGACGGDVVFSNRSAKSSNTGRCVQCGAECDTGAESVVPGETLTPYAAGWPRVIQHNEQNDMRSRAFQLGGVAIAGAAVGAIAALLVTRRR